MTVQDVYRVLNEVAPFETQADFDNSGLLVGSPAQEVTGILLALDVTMPVIDEALALGAQLIITHHPLMFSARRRITDEDTEGRLITRLIRGNLSLIAAHTNLDQAPGGINDTLAALCELQEVSGEGFFRSGLLPSPMTAGCLAGFLQERLGDAVRLMGPESALVSRMGVCSGSGSDEWILARDAGCQAFLSGEIKHHHALAMADAGIVALECGHDATEAPGIRALAAALQNALDEIQWKVRVYESSSPAYAFPSIP